MILIPEKKLIINIHYASRFFDIFRIDYKSVLVMQRITQLVREKSRPCSRADALPNSSAVTNSEDLNSSESSKATISFKRKIASELYTKLEANKTNLIRLGKREGPSNFYKVSTLNLLKFVNKIR